MAKRQIGDIFCSADLSGADPSAPRTYWKINGDPGSGWISTRDSYPVVRCSKFGKEYKSRTWILVSRVDQISDDRIINVDVGVKADIAEGAKIGQLKRRLSFLDRRINADQKELIDIVDQLEQSR